MRVFTILYRRDVLILLQIIPQYLLERYEGLVFKKRTKVCRKAALTFLSQMPSSDSLYKPIATLETIFI